MVQVVRRAASAAARRAPSRAVQRRARKHKVIMESVTQEKKKLRSVISFEVKAPTGYTFIPAGNPLLTTTCKERCRKEGLQIYAVSTTPHARTHNLSQHVHRIGYHFPSTVVAATCSELGLYLTSTGKAVPFHTLGALDHHIPTDSEVSQEVINMEARDALKDLFPNIPDKDLFQIIKTAFQKGQGKVGTAPELPLARRAQLAVVAHIRHLYTDYDRLLKSGSFHEARSAVEQSTLAKLIAWRGDDENGQTVLEDVFREVIVISDDEESETDDLPAAAGTRDNTHEVQTLPLGSLNYHGQDPTLELSEEAPPPGFQFVAKIPAKRISDRRGFSRYQAWNRALNRYRAEAHGTNTDRRCNSPSGQQSPRHVKRLVAIHESPNSGRPNTSPQSSEATNRPAPNRVHHDTSAHQMLAVSATTHLADKPLVGAQDGHYLDNQRTHAQNEPTLRAPSLTIQTTQDGHLLESGSRSNEKTPFVQLPAYRDKDSTRPERSPTLSSNRADMPVFVSGPKEPPSSGSHFGHWNGIPPPHYLRPQSKSQDLVLPSIETPWILEKRRLEGRLEHLTKRMSLRSLTPTHSGESSYWPNETLPDSPVDESSKRRRLTYYAPRHDPSSLDSPNEKPLGGPHPGELESSRGQNHRSELVSEPHTQGNPHIRRDHHPLLEQPVHLAHAQGWQLKPFVSLQGNPESRPVMDRMRFVGVPEQASMHYSQPGSPSTSGMVKAGDRPYRTALNSFHSEVHPPYHHDRSLRVDRAWPPIVEGIGAPLWQSRTDGGRVTVHDNGKLYADGFVRRIGIHEARSVEYLGQRSKNQAISLGNSNRSIGTGLPGRQITQASSQTQRHPTLEQIPVPRAVRTAHKQFPDASFGNRLEPGVSNTTPRPKRPGNGFSTTRRVHDPRSFPMAEQNRPIYVQRVESHLPRGAESDGRHMVIVD